MRCPTCQKDFDPAQSKALPFCSERCRQIDLGHWLDEKFSVPYDRPEDEEFREEMEGREQDEEGEGAGA